MNPWRVVWRAITKNRLTVFAACIVVAGAIALVDRVMVHRYRLGMQWGPDKRLELEPAPASSTPIR